MHYIGMQALHASAHMMHNPVYVLASVLIAVVASGLALWLAFASETRPPLLVCATVLGCAISGMHYTAMAGLTLHPIVGVPPSGTPAISGDLLAVIVSVVAFLVSGVFMLALVPDQREAAADAVILSDAGEQLSVVAAEPAALEKATPVSVPPIPDHPPQPLSEPRAYETTLPVEKYRGSKTILVADIFSVHANAHYTYVFNGREDIFCPLSISEIIVRLPPDMFFRVHRSYIVNIERVARLKRAGDGGVADLDSPVRRSVPVSRGRLSQLREKLTAYLQSKEN